MSTRITNQTTNEPDQTELTEYQVAWCILCGIALAVVFLDLFVWRP